MDTVQSPKALFTLVNSKIPKNKFIKIIVWFLIIGILLWGLPFAIGGYAIYYFYTKGSKKFTPALAIASVLTLFIGIGWIAVFASASQSQSTTTSTQAQTVKTTTTNITTVTVTKTPTPTSTPTATPTPTESPQQQEDDFKAGVTSTTVSEIAKNANADTGTDLKFTGQIGSFAQDSSGNTTAANIIDPSDYSQIQISFPTGIDITQINKGDTITVWGTGLGEFSGKNAFGATINEAGVDTLYLTDTTTGYSYDGN